MNSEYAGYDNKPAIEQIEFKELTLQEGLVPNVIGMGAKDAVYVLEKYGLRISFSGRGQVVSQSVSPGQRIVKGQSVALVLK
jgi:cell division protein FtsI (penicillin-binding protein 3)